MIVISQNLIPIALYASVEIIKMAQAYLIGEDIEMYDERTDIACIPRSWNLGDDLGQVEYVFSDKTGTLTENVMKFKNCTIAGREYGQPEGDWTYKGQAEIWQDTLTILEVKYGANEYAAPEFDFLGVALARTLTSEVKEERERAVDFFTTLCLCHTVFIDHTQLGMTPLAISCRNQSSHIPFFH